MRAFQLSLAVVLALLSAATSINHYTVLGVPRDASRDTIRDAYKRLALALHPDKNPSPEASAKFTLLSDAYAALHGYAVYSLALHYYES